MGNVHFRCISRISNARKQTQNFTEGKLAIEDFGVQVQRFRFLPENEMHRRKYDGNSNF